MKKIENENVLRMRLFNEAVHHSYPIAVYLAADGTAPKYGLVIRNPMEMVNFVILYYKTGVAENAMTKGFTTADFNKLKPYLK